MVESDRSKSKTIPSFKEVADSPIHTILTKENRQKESPEPQSNKLPPSSRPRKKTSIHQTLMNKLSAANEMAHAVAILDYQLQWVDKGVEYLTDNKDFSVVGVIGGQGVGKSTIASMLAGARPTGARRSYMFWPQSRDVRENGVNQTYGVYMAVSTERFIFLDTQPLLSHSLLDNIMYGDRSFMSEHLSPDTQIDIQSLQMLTFLMSVCHVLVVISDWSVDPMLPEMLKTAEMLKPPPLDNNNRDEHLPHVVFVYNFSDRSDFSQQEEHQATLKLLMKHSKLVPKDPLVYWLPDNKLPIRGATPPPPQYLQYQGHASFQHCFEQLRNKVFSLPRGNLTSHPLTEKTWFHMAARVWDSLQKSQQLIEYGRLLQT